MNSIIRVAIYIAGTYFAGQSDWFAYDAEAGEIVLDINALSVAGGAAVTGALAWWRRDVAKGKAT